MLDVRMKDETTSWQEWYENNPRPRMKSIGKLTHGVGVNDLDYVVSVVDKSSGVQIVLYRCKKYRVWEKMLQRTYSKKWAAKYPTYLGCSVSENFKYAKSFSLWMDTQITKEGDETLHLDKDILFPGNKMYSEETCCFIPQFLNKSLNVCDRFSGDLPIGVKRCGRRYGSTLHKKDNVRVSLGWFNTPEEAHKAWQLGRALLIEEALVKYSSMNCYREDVDISVRNRVTKLRDDALMGVKTVRLD